MKKKPTPEANRLRQFMKHVNLTQLELAEVYGVNASAVNKYVTGHVKIPFELVKLMHNKYKMNFNWFYMGTGPMKVGEIQRKNLVSDISDIYASIGMIMASIDKMRDDIKLLSRSIKTDA